MEHKMLKLFSVVLMLLPTTAVTAGVDINVSSFYCMLNNVYYEARGEPYEGMMAVNQVVLNRAAKKKKTVCEIIKEPKQFSWLNSRKTSVEQLTTATRVATRLAPGASVFEALYGGHPTGKNRTLKGFYFYHNVNVKPKWAKAMKTKRVIGNHVFYKGEYR